MVFLSISGSKWAETKTRSVAVLEPAAGPEWALENLLETMYAAPGGAVTLWATAHEGESARARAVCRQYRRAVETKGWR